MENETREETSEYVFDGSSFGYDWRTDLRHDVYEQDINGPAPSPLSKSPITINGIVLLMGSIAGPINVNATEIKNRLATNCEYGIKYRLSKLIRHFAAQILGQFYQQSSLPMVNLFHMKGINTNIQILIEHV